MSRPIQPGRYSSRPRYSGARGTNVFALVRERGVYGMAVAVAAMALGLSPVVFLLWWNWLRLVPVPIAPAGAHVRVQVKPAQHTRDAENQKPGDTALVYVTCEVQQAGQWRDLLQLADEARSTEGPGPVFVDKERVYLRPAKGDACPFALLGEPPVSAWLPAGEYEMMVVYLGDRGLMNSHAGRPAHFPWVSERVVQTLPAGERTVVRVPLYHHERCVDSSLTVRPLEGAGGAPQSGAPRAELGPLLAAIEKLSWLPTPCGVLMDLPEPAIRHTDGHRNCEVDFRELLPCRREWTHSQIERVLCWLPPEAVEARRRLEQIDASLWWREMLGGWYCYAAAGVAGLVFARWATIAKLSPYRSRRELRESLKLLLVIFLAGVLLWIVVSALGEGHWLRVIHVR